MRNDAGNQEKRAVTILLTQYGDTVSKFIYYLCNKGYTHASISFDKGEVFYSFNYKGFCTESLEKHKQRGVSRSISYQLEVTEKEYQEMQGFVQSFLESEQQLGYARLSLLLCVMGIPFKEKMKFFCSQFVARVMEQAIKLEKPSALYLPSDFCKELESSDRLKKVILNPI